MAALMVALFHVGQTPYIDATGAARKLIDPVVKAVEWTWTAQMARIFGNGPGAVILFFVLSGFVLTLLLQRMTNTNEQNARDFLIGRVFRIYPAVWTTITVFCVIYVVTGYAIASNREYTISNILLNLVLIKADIDGVMWSMRLEIIAAPLIFLISISERRFSSKAISLPFLVLLGLSFVGEWNRAIGEPGSFGQIYAFIAGMAAALHGQQIVAKLRRPRLVLTSVIILFALTRPVVGWSSYWTILIETILGATLIAVLAFTRDQNINSALARFYGQISYSFYLLHPLCLIVLLNLSDWTTQTVASGYPPLVIAAGLFVISVAAITPLAWLQYLLIERRGIDLGKKLQQHLGHRHRIDNGVA